MGAEISNNIRKVRFQIKQMGERAVRGVNHGLEKTAIETAQQLETFMPFDTGLLRDSITINGKGKATGHYERNKSGQYERQTFTIEIDGRRWNKRGNKRRTVASYAWLMNSSLLPYGEGTFNLGKKSQALRDAGQDVGGFFMERAREFAERHVLAITKNSVRQAMRNRVSVGTDIHYGERITYGEDE